LTELESDLTGRLQAAEDAIYQAPDDPLVNWDLPDLEAALQAAGLRLHTALAYETHVEERRLTAAHLARWFTVSDSPGRPTYASRLRVCLSATELQRVEACFRRQLLDQIVPWRTTLVYVVAS
jgi:putative ATPase